MSRLLGLSGIRSLDQFKSLSGSSSRAANKKIMPNASLETPESVSSGSFANLKLTAEKLVREQASARTDLELANSKLKKLTEQIYVLEEKLQIAYNENAKLKVMQKEDEKLWKGLESKFSSTKTLCDQLVETLQQLNGQVQQAEKDKAYFEDKLSATSVTLSDLHENMKSMSSKLDSSEQTMRNREKELLELGFEKGNLETALGNVQNRVACLIEEKDSVLKKLEKDGAAHRTALENLTTNMEKLQLELRVKEDDVLELSFSKEKLERENKDLLSSRDDFSDRLQLALLEVKNLEEFLTMLVEEFEELERKSLEFSEKSIQLNALFDSCLNLAQHEKDLVSKCAQRKFDQINDQCASAVSEKNALQLDNHELKNKILELQKEQEFSMVQHAEECRVAEEKIRKLESEAETLVSKQSEMHASILKLEDNLRVSSENSRISEEKVQDLSMKLSELELSSKGLIDGLNTEILKKQEESDVLQKEVEKREENTHLLEERVKELENTVEEKEQLLVELKTREEQIGNQKTEVMASLADTESKLQEAKKEYNHMLESKHLELSKHLKEISQRNDQAINDIRMKYEVEKQETVNLEKEKADKIIQDVEKRCEQKVEEIKEESRQRLLQVQEEHAAAVSNIHKEHAKRETILTSKHTEELRRTELHAEAELREQKTKMLRSEHEAQLRALRCEHEDECKRLEEELDIQKEKEERQRTLLQLQWKVMGDNPQEDQEVTSKKNYSITSKTRNKESNKRIQQSLDRAEIDEKATQTPVSNMLKKAENVNNLPKHSRKVTHHEYEIETSNGRTITKRRKTKSTVMFGDPRKQRKKDTPTAKTPKNVIQRGKEGLPPKPSNIGDLFTEGSLNPYVDDPYAFD
ncbi:synaptonemal complex protein 1-like isoform X3 [Salvia splendens]|uniref:synaptonemal complex protein 1-like isoform X3 n=1 Tax=Salvia splendens TaxID=180675 RepID=UPI001C26F77E|nr:synaptonemal complex protein 1-like isoform X3 [Salvia splendens]